MEPEGGGNILAKLGMCSSYRFNKIPPDAPLRPDFFLSLWGRLWTGRCENGVQVQQVEHLWDALQVNQPVERRGSRSPPETSNCSNIDCPVLEALADRYAVSPEITFINMIVLKRLEPRHIHFIVLFCKTTTSDILLCFWGQKVLRGNGRFFKCRGHTTQPPRAQPAPAWF